MSDETTERPGRSFWKDAAILLGGVVLYYALQIWILPAVGIPT